MAGELNFYGIYIPLVLIQALLAYVIFSGLVRVLDKYHLTRWMLWPTIFNLCLYIVVLGLTVWISHLLL
ncbi:MAG: DUF1656 domain-containing protein [Moraxellaceae bacterium]|nr:MAG: DUF1656 domain-containing protein [Moraxellaceae bacterium]